MKPASVRSLIPCRRSPEPTDPLCRPKALALAPRIPPPPAAISMLCRSTLGKGPNAPESLSP